MNDLEKQVIVTKEYNSMWELYKLMIPELSKHNIPILEIICKPVNYAGRAYRGAHIVEINTAYFHEMNGLKELHETIAHELAHVIQYMLYPFAKQAHGPEFRSIMQSIGYSGNTYHTMDTRKAKETAKKVSKGDDLFDLS